LQTLHFLWYSKCIRENEARETEMTYTVLVTTENENGELAYPAVTGVTEDRLEIERAEIRAGQQPGDTVTIKVIAEK
jgi:hypothetical protein